MATTYPTDLPFDLVDGRKRAAVLKAAREMGLDVGTLGGLKFRVTVASPMEAYRFGQLTAQYAAAAGAPLDQADTPKARHGA